jgi:hypothetical protein
MSASKLPGLTSFRLNAFDSGSIPGKEARSRASISQAEKERAMSREGKGKLVVEAQPQKSKSGQDKKKGILSFI